jgi:hypothetical protein
MEHNQKAADEIILSTVKGNHNILYVSGVGTGKSYVTKYLIEMMYANKKVAYVVPKHSIANYLKEEAGFDKYDNVRFYTYNYFDNAAKCMKVFESNDFIVLDEAHHVGSFLYGSNIVEAMKKNKANVLGLTATPFRDSDKVDVNTFFDKSVKGLTNFEAIQQGLMPRFEYIVCTPGSYKQKKDEKVVLDYENSDELLSDIIKTNNKEKWLCFFPSTSKLEAHKRLIEELFPEHHICVLYASLDNTKEVLEEVRTHKKCVVLSCNILLEGLHIDNVDGIILFRDVESLTVFQQILGRVCSIGKKENPIVIDCTKVAYKMMRKLLRVEQGGRDSSRRTLGSGIHGILKVSLENKKYHDITKLLWMTSNHMSFVFRDKEYTSFYAACEAYHLNRQLVMRYAWENNMLPEEVMELFIKEGKTVKEHGTHKIIYRGKEYRSAAELCREYGYEGTRIRDMARRMGISVTEVIDGLRAGKYEAKKHAFIVRGIEYKNIENFCKKNSVARGSILSASKRKNISMEAAAEYMLEYHANKGFEYKGRKYPSFKACCEKLGVDPNHASEMARKNGRTKAEQLDCTLEYKKRSQKMEKPYLINGKKYSLTSFAREFHVGKNTIMKMEKNGMTRQDAMEYVAKERSRDTLTAKCG